MMISFLLKHLTVLALAIAAGISCYGGIAGAAVEQDSSSYSSTFFYCVTMAILVTLYLSKVNGILGVLSIIVSLLLYKMVYDLDFCLLFVALVCQILLFVKTDYGWYGFWGGLHVYQIYMVGLSCIPWLWFSYFCFSYTKCMAQVLPPTLRGELNYFDPSRPREPQSVLQSAIDRLFLSWLSLLKEQDYTAPLADFLNVHRATVASAFRPILYLAEDVYNSLHGFLTKLGIAFHEIIYEHIECCEPESLRARRLADAAVEATMKENELWAEKIRKQAEYRRHQERLDREAEDRAEERRRHKAQEEQRKAHEAEQAKQAKQKERERRQRKVPASESREIPSTRLPDRYVPHTVNLWAFQHEESEFERKRAQHRAWAAEQRKILSPEDFSEMMMARIKKADESARQAELELYSNPLRVTNSDPSVRIENKGPPFLFQWCSPGPVPAGETVVAAVKPPQTGPFFAPETLRPSPRPSTRPSLTDRIVPLTPVEVQSYRPSNLLLGGIGANPYVEQQEPQVYAQAPLQLEFQSEQQQQYLQQQYLLEQQQQFELQQQQQQLQLEQQFQEQNRQAQQFQQYHQQQQFEEQQALQQYHQKLQAQSAESQPAPASKLLPALTAPSGQSMLGPAPTGSSVFASSNPSKPSTPINKLFAAAAEGRYAPTEESQPAQQEELGPAWDPMDVDAMDIDEPETSEQVVAPAQQDDVEQHHGVAQHHGTGQHYTAEQPCQKWLDEQEEEALIWQMLECADEEPLQHQQPTSAASEPHAVEQPVQQHAPEPVQQTVVQEPVQQPASQESVQQPIFQGFVQQPVVQAPVEQPVVQAPAQKFVFQGGGGQGPVQEPAAQAPVPQFAFQQPVQQPVVPEPVKQAAAPGPVRRPVTPVNLIIAYPGSEPPVQPSVEQPPPEWQPAEDTRDREEEITDEVRIPNKRSKNRDRSESPESEPEPEPEPSPSKRKGKGKATSSSSARPRSYQAQIAEMVARGYTEEQARVQAGRSFR